jgi:phosphate transport system permease protein
MAGPAHELRPPVGGSPERSERAARRPAGASPLGDWIFRGICQAAAFLVIALAALLLVILVAKSWLAIQTVGVHFLTGITWDPEPNHRIFGALAFIYGTLATSAIAMLLAVPFGVGTATYLSEIAPGWLRRSASFLVEMLAAIPSVVYGFWGLFFLAPRLQVLITRLGGPNHGGVGILAAGLVLAIMIVPYISAVSFDVCRAVPASQRAGALALGATRWQMIWSVVLPYARPGIIGGCFLALGRALGETMAVTMLIGNRPEIPGALRDLLTGNRPEIGKCLHDLAASPFALGDSIASSIANQFTEATYDLYLSALAELGLVLFFVTVAVNALARLLIWRVGRVGKRRGQGGKETGRQGVERVRGSAAAVDGRTAAGATVGPRVGRGNRRTASLVDHVMTGVLGLALVSTVGPLFLILGYLVYEGIGALNWDFFVKLPAPVGELGGGMANALYGSALLIALASLFAVPVGVLTAIYLAEYRSGALGATVRFIGELLGGVPSIVIGIFAYSLVVVPMGHFSGWAGAFALGVMMIPIVMRASEEALRLVPGSLRDAGHALGASQWQIVLRVTLPAALPAVVTAVFLAVARIAGETAPLLLTASSNQYWPNSPNDFTPSLPVYIFTYAVSPYADWHRQAWAAALVLLVGVMLLNFGIRVLTGKRLVRAE